MDLIEELGPLALGTRIRNLGERLMKDMAKVYQEQNVDFEPRWFTFFQLILRRKEISVTEIARELNQSHPAAVQVVNALVRKKLVSTRVDNNDKRKRLVRLTRKGEKLTSELQPIWEDVFAVSNEILEESAPGLLSQILLVENALERKSTYERMQEKHMQRIKDSIEIFPYSQKFRLDFKRLNEEWLKEYLDISPHDKKILNNPEQEILRQKGEIMLMAQGDEIIGTYALQRTGKSTCELSKFTIHKAHRGRGLGVKMLTHALDHAKQRGFEYVLLLTHDKLTEATQLYSRMGFEKISGHPDLVDKSGRCSMTMKYAINHKKR
ncbi:MAG TPA: bifunctional helix-turn-helix transcriptional regulator/GNAT family N-acetyltransferase [Bacteroidales bacterium]|nr:bifunctional helix-turn-helix transcriptional regulator/GNAT family N-acetyltransferase [Bacteroidales bacterium]